jgi:hypothetical protein
MVISKNCQQLIHYVKEDNLVSARVQALGEKSREFSNKYTANPHKKYN